MSDLKQRLTRLIASDGAISVADYMAVCLFDPKSGYYTTQEPFGVSGDFTTAPEISQMFGELLAVWTLSAWHQLGKPVPSMLAEIGPGNGTLMADMLRTLNQLDPAFVILSRIGMIEASPRLAEKQRAKLAAGKAKPTWFTEVSALPQVPLILVGNEIFDALPFRQFVKTPTGWRERMVSLTSDDALCFSVGMSGIDESILPQGAADAPEGAIFEVAPAREALMDLIASHIAKHGGAALFADYGHLKSGVADTFQALRGHAYDDVFANPGQADLTSHVDFDALSVVARGHGLDVTLATQGEFLLAMGLLERAGAVGASMDQAGRERVQRDVERLAGPGEMGNLFKVMMIAPKGVSLPPFGSMD
jgi:SAM-dependent MidA family methyltransferase